MCLYKGNYCSLQLNLKRTEQGSVKLSLWKGIFFFKPKPDIQTQAAFHNKVPMESEGKLHPVYLHGFFLLVNTNGSQVHQKHLN